MASYIYRFVNGPARTRSFAWNISADCTVGVSLEGRCSAFGGGVEFTIFRGGSSGGDDIPEIPGGTPPSPGLYITVRGNTYLLTDGEGAFTVSVPTEEWTEALIGAGPPGVRIFERATDLVSMTLSIGGISLNWTGGSVGLGISSGIAAFARAVCSGGFVAGNGSGSLSIQPDTMPYIAEEGPIAQSLSGTFSASGGGSTWAGAWSASESCGHGVSVSWECELTQNGTPVSYLPYIGYWSSGASWRNYGAYAESHTAADRSGSAGFLVQAVDGVSTEEFEAQLLPVGSRHVFTGSGSTDFRFRYRRRWIGGQTVTPAGYLDQTQNNHVTELGALGAKYKRVGEPDALQTWLLGKLWRWSALELSHESSKLIDDCTSLTPGGTFAGAWSATGGGSVSVSSGAVRLSGPAGKKLERTASGTSTATTRWHGYTRLRLRLRCDQPSHTIRLELGPPINEYGTLVSKQWSIQTGDANTWSDVYIDVAGEHNGYPISRANSIWEHGPEPTAQGWHFLNISGDYLALSELGAGTYDVDLIELDDVIVSSGEVTSPVVHALTQYVGASGELARVLVATCGGTQTLDVLANPTEDHISFLVPSMALPSGGMCLPGWGVSDLAPLAGSYTEYTITNGGPWGGSTNIIEFDTYADRKCSFMPVSWISTGLLWDGTGWEHTFAGGAQPVGELDAQWSVATLDWDWPEALDELPSGGDIGFGTVIGGAVWGRLLKAPATLPPFHRLAIAGEAEATGSGTPASDTDTINPATGFFSTPSFGESGFVCVGATNTVQVTATGSIQAPKPTASIELSLGHKRLVLVEGSRIDTGSCLALAQSFTGRLARAWKPSDGSTILIELRSQAGGEWERKDTGIAGSCPELSWDTVGQDGSLLMAYVDSGIKLRSSLDEGGTWTMPTTISTSGTHPALVISQSGVRHFFWWDAGTIKARSYDSQMQQVQAVRTVVSSGAADDAMRIEALLDGSFLMIYRTTSGSLTALTSTDGAQTFS